MDALFAIILFAFGMYISHKSDTQIIDRIKQEKTICGISYMKQGPTTKCYELGEVEIK